MISYIVSTHASPKFLTCAIAMLEIQKGPKEILIADNSPEGYGRYWEGKGASWYHTKQEHYFLAIEMLVPHCDGDWLCFPSDDSYYVPTFAERMLETAWDDSLDLVYADTLYDPRLSGKYAILDVQPQVYRIDKASFILKKSWFRPFSRTSEPNTDGVFIEALVADGIRHGKARGGALVVHS